MKSSALIAVVLSGAAIVGYVSYRTLTSQPAPEPAAHVAEAEQTEPAPAETLPDFSLPNLTGGQQSILSWPDNAMIINFWATWCGPCLREIPLLKTFQDEQRDNAIQVVGIAIDRLEPVQAFVAEMGFNYPVLVGQTEGSQAAASFGVDFFALPFTVFTDHDRNILGVHTGEIHAEDLADLAAVLADLQAGRIDLVTARDRVAGRI